MTVKVIGIGEASYSNQPLDILKTYALSTCVAVTAYCPIHGVAGMIHIALPAPLYGESDAANIYRYASTGLPYLFDRLRMQYGCQVRELNIQMYGGAASAQHTDFFKIGLQNVEATRQVLDRLNAKCQYEDTGGHHSRTVEMNVADGRIHVTTLPLAF